MIENLNELAKFVKGGAEVLQKAIESEEKMSLEFIEGSFVSDDELTTLKESVAKDAKKVYEKVGYDYAMKDIKTDLGLEIEGKDRKAILEAARKKIMDDAKIEPNKKVDELSISLKNLQTQYEKDLGLKTQENDNLRNNLKDYRINGDLNKHIPEGLNGIDVNDFMTLAKTTANFDYDDNGNLVVRKGDTILKDKMENPINPKDYLTEFANSKKWLQSDGRGASDEGGTSSTFKNINEVYKHMEENKINPMSEAGKKLIEDFNNLKQ